MQQTKQTNFDITSANTKMYNLNIHNNTPAASGGARDRCGNWQLRYNANFQFTSPSPKSKLSLGEPKVPTIYPKSKVSRFN